MQNHAMQKIQPTTLASREVLQQVLVQKRESLRRLLPPSVNPERFVESLMQIHSEVPDVGQCTIASVWGCALGAAKLGLEIGKTLQLSSLVRYANTATLIIGYRGYIALALENGYRDIAAEVVYQGDDFEISLGTNRHIRHIPRYETEEPIGAYCTAVDPTGGIVFHYMPIREINKIAEKVLARFHGKSVWATDRDAMIRKTPIRHMLSKLAKIRPEQRRIMEAVEAGRELRADPSPMPAGSDDVEILDAEATAAEPPAPRFPGNQPAQTQAAEPAQAPPRRGRPPKTEKEEMPPEKTEPVTTAAEAPPEESDKHLDAIAATLDRTGFPESEFLAAVARLCEMSTVPRNLAGIPRTARGFIASQAADIIRARQEGGAK